MSDNPLFIAWEALASYAAQAEEDTPAKDKVLQALKLLSGLMADGSGDPEGPTPATTFGATMTRGGVVNQHASQDRAAMVCEAPQCGRTFSTEQGLINHLKKVHAEREHQTKATPANDKD